MDSIKKLFETIWSRIILYVVFIVILMLIFFFNLSPEDQDRIFGIFRFPK